MSITPQQQTDATILEVSQLNFAAKRLLESEFAAVWVSGEISNFIQAASGHWYFTLKDDKAQVRCAMFKGLNQQVTSRPQEGQKVVVRAKVSLYAPRGDYQLIVSHLEDAGLGALHRAFELLKQKLAAEGLFVEEHKQEIPSTPQTLGVVTSASGAAVHDIIRVMQRRAPHIDIIVYPSLVQGEQAAENIAKMIQLANELKQCEVLIVGRGGGSLEDLWAFNEEVVARAIFASKLPIISAVGHEVDVSIADFVADLRAATPSAAAEIVSEDSQQLSQGFDYYQERLQQLIQQCLQLKKHQLALLQQRCAHPRHRLNEQQQKLHFLRQQLDKLMQYNLRQQQQSLQQYSQRLGNLSPLATLQRGYAIVKDAASKTVITNTQQVNIGQQVITQLQHGQLRCQIEEVIKYD